MALNRERFAELARQDFEFTRETRYFTGGIKLGFGDKETWVLEFSDGKLTAVTDGSTKGALPIKVSVSGTEEQWDALLQDKPPPFYQCIQSAAVKHGLKISDSNETFAYLPGLNRMTTLLRQLKNGRA